MLSRVSVLIVMASLVSLTTVAGFSFEMEVEGYPVDTSFPCYGHWTGSRRVPMGCNGDACNDKVYVACFGARESCERACNVKPADYENDPQNPDRPQGENDFMRRYDALPCVKACSDTWIKCDGECAARKNAADVQKKADQQAAWVAQQKAAADAAARAQAAAAAKKAEEDKANLARIAAQNAQFAKDEAARRAKIQAEEAERAKRIAEQNNVKPAPTPAPKPSKPSMGGNGGALQPIPSPMQPAKSSSGKSSPAIKLQGQINTNVNINSGNTNTVNNIVNNNAGQVNIGSINVAGGSGDVNVNIRLLDSNDLDETKPASKTTRKRVCTQANIQKYPELQLPCLCTAAQKKTFPQIRDDCAAYDKKVAARKAANKKVTTKKF
jgi:hypothetical protein